MANTNQFPGLSRGPIDHESSSVINSISGGSIEMGSGVILEAPTIRELLPRVKITTTTGDPLAYGVVVGGDVDGVYGDGSASSDDATAASNGEGQAVVVVTRGRCLAKVFGGSGGLLLGAKLTLGDSVGHLREVDATITAPPFNTVIATALQPVGANNSDMIAVEVNKEGIFNAGDTTP